MRVTPVQTIWIAQVQGHVCVQIKLQSPGHEPVYSQRNIDVGEPLDPQRPQARLIEVRNPTNEVVTITMALINHRANWQMSLMPSLLTNVAPGEVRPVTLTVQPPELTGLLETTASHVLEAKTSDIIIEILKTCPDEEMLAALQRNLLELCGYFLELGDFARLIELHQRLTGGDNIDPHMAVVRGNVLQFFASMIKIVAHIKPY